MSLLHQPQNGRSYEVWDSIRYADRHGRSFSAAVNAGVVLRTAISSADLAEIDESCQGDECVVGT